MNAADLQTFIDVTRRFFEKTTDNSPQIGHPFIQMREPVLLDYSGFIEISGSSSGFVYVTTPRGMLEDLVGREGISSATDDDLGDMVGEMANTISSNARKEFGANFKVSVPQVVVGEKVEQIELPHMTFVVPIKWENYDSYLVVGLKE